jgi:ankyrin repeat protein
MDDMDVCARQVFRLAQRGRTSELQELLKTLNLQATEAVGRRLLFACLVAIRNNHATTVALLVSQPQHLPDLEAFQLRRLVTTTLADYAARFAGPEVVRLVLRPNTLNHWLYRPLAQALRSRNDAVAYALVEAGANVRYATRGTNCAGGPLLELTSTGGLYMERRYGDRQARLARLVRLDRHVQKLLAAKVGLHERDIGHHVKQNGHGDVVRVLHRAKARVDGQLLKSACVRVVLLPASTATSKEYLQRLQTVRVLLRCKVHADAPESSLSSQTYTALHMAIEHGAPSLIQILLAHNASVAIPNGRGDLPIDAALAWTVKHGPTIGPRIVALLLDAKADPTTDKTRATAEAMHVVSRALFSRALYSRCKENTDNNKKREI